MVSAWRHAAMWQNEWWTRSGAPPPRRHVAGRRGPARLEPHADAEQEVDEVAVAAARGELDAAVGQVADVAFAQVLDLTRADVARAEVDGEVRRGGDTDRDVEPAACGPGERGIVEIRRAGEGVVVAAPLDGRRGGEVGEADAAVGVRADRSARHHELRADGAVHDVVARREVDLDAAADGGTEADALRFVAVVEEAGVDAQAEGASGCDEEDEVPAEADADVDDLTEVADRFGDGERAAGLEAGWRLFGRLCGQRCGKAEGHDCGGQRQTTSSHAVLRDRVMLVLRPVGAGCFGGWRTHRIEIVERTDPPFRPH